MSFLSEINLHDRLLAINPLVTYILSTLTMVLFWILFYITNNILKHTFKIIDYEARLCLVIRLISTLHAIISTTCSLLVLYFDKEIYLNELLYKSYGITITLSISIGYLLYDFTTQILMKEIREYSSLFHHTVAILAFHACSIRGVFPLIAIVRLTSEFSTPFINNRWIFMAINKHNSKLFFYNGVMILISFGLCRVLPIIPIWLQFFSVVGSDAWNQIDISDKILCVVTSSPLDVLNVYWYYKIIQGAIKILAEQKKSL